MQGPVGPWGRDSHSLQLFETEYLPVIVCYVALVNQSLVKLHRVVARLCQRKGEWKLCRHRPARRPGGEIAADSANRASREKGGRMVLPMTDSM
eukprot:675331-Rhodomonas_salina.1